MLRFENIEFLYGLLAIPVLILIYWAARWARKKSLRKFGDTETLNRLFIDYSGVKPTLKFVLAALTLAFIIIGLANLQVGAKLEKVERKGVDIMIALDVSNSMKAEDVKPSRLARAKRTVSNLIDNLRNDRIGLIAFAGDAYLQMPPTSDFAAAKMFLNSTNTEVVPKQGTAIGAAIRLALKSFSEEDEYKKALIIITDGENHEDDAVSAAEEAAKKNVVVYAIGVGTKKGGTIPIYKNSERVDFKRDKDGSVVVTKMNPNMLQRVAAAGGGDLIQMAGGEVDLAGLIDEIGGMKKKKFGETTFAEYEDRFQYFFGAALFFLLIELLISNRKNKFIDSLNLFEEKK